MKTALKSFTCCIIMIFAVMVFHTDRNSYYIESYRAVSEQKDAGASIPSIECSMNLIAPYSVSPRITLDSTVARVLTYHNTTFVKIIASIRNNNHFNILKSHCDHTEKISATSRSLASYYIYALNRIRI